MAVSGNTHSLFVARAKVLLPLVSLALLATIFLFARDKGGDSTIPYARVDIESLAREQRLDGPTFATVTKDGASLQISAGKVRPDPSNRDVVNSTVIVAILEMPDAGSVTVQAQNGVIDGPSRTAELSGGVEVETSTGYSLLTDRIASMLDFSRIESPGDVVGTAPSGEISAGSMVLTRNSDNEGYVLVFKDRVKLIYQP